MIYTEQVCRHCGTGAAAAAAARTDEHNWFHDEDNVLSLAAWLVDNFEFSSDQDGQREILRLFEKPWHWTEKWNEYRAESEVES
jgi:hypothetical protein